MTATEDERPAGVRRISVADAKLPPAAPKEPALPLSTQQLGTIFAWAIAVVAVVVLILVI
ncbi:MAG TPA: hypothetical protein VFZ89_00935 [Solirubrobacteraceae bacterium]